MQNQTTALCDRHNNRNNKNKYGPSVWPTRTGGSCPSH